LVGRKLEIEGTVRTEAVMVLTAEQRKRMEDNRITALEIKRKKQIEKEKNGESTITGSSRNASSTVFEFEAGGFVGETELQNKKRRTEVDTKNPGDADTRNCTRGGAEVDLDAFDGDDESSLEDFEQNASTHISKTEAQRIYCIPLGTLAVCSYIEKDNPHRKKWSKMKLYSRSDVRRRARKRFGGKGELVEERERRRKNRFEKDLKEMKDVFS